MKTVKRIFLSLLCCMLAASLFTTASAASMDESTAHADTLVALNLFKGTSDGYALDGQASRIQGLVMTLRLLGLEDEALAYEKPCPFTDVPTWAQCYAAYAYDNGLTKGSGVNTFSPDADLAARDYITFLLRGLGYDDAAGDFSWSTAIEFAAQLGMIDTASVTTLNGKTLQRAGMVDLSYTALTHLMHGMTDTTLAEKLLADGVFTAQAGQTTGILAMEPQTYSDRVVVAETAVEVTGEPIVREDMTFTTSTGDITVTVLTVNPAHPAVTIKSAMVENTLGATDTFANIVESSDGATAVVNANFFAAYSDYQIPVGHSMADGELLYCSSGLTSLGITEDGKLTLGRPSIFARIKSLSTIDNWPIYEVNSSVQADYVSTLYTPAYGKNVTITNDGYLLVVVNDVITKYVPVSAGGVYTVPANGYFVYMGKSYISTNYFYEPVVGTQLTPVSYFLQYADEEGFELDGVTSIISGAPRLVKDGVIVTELETGFTETRFTTLSSPRTAIGIDAEGKLIIVSVRSATIQQMRELMLALGCVDAFNLDGGGSTAMYYNGQFIATPGRELTTTLQIFVEE